MRGSSHSNPYTGPIRPSNPYNLCAAGNVEVEPSGIVAREGE